MPTPQMLNHEVKDGVLTLSTPDGRTATVSLCLAVGGTFRIESGDKSTTKLTVVGAAQTVRNFLKYGYTPFIETCIHGLYQRKKVA